MTLDPQTITYRDGEIELAGLFYCGGAGAGKRPGILVVHGGAGLDAHARRRAERFAQLGFAVFACDMYGSGVAGDRARVMAAIGSLRSDAAKLRRRAAAGLDVLRAHPLVDGRIAAVGYCFGGMTALEIARGGADLMGAVSVHGSLDTAQPAAPNTVKAKILVCHGALDPHVPMTQVTGLTEELTHAAIDFQVIVYGNAMHGFTHEEGSSIPGVAYHAQTDARSTIAIENFFSELFEFSPQPSG